MRPPRKTSEVSRSASEVYPIPETHFVDAPSNSHYRRHRGTCGRYAGGGRLTLPLSMYCKRRCVPRHRRGESEGSHHLHPRNTLSLCARLRRGLNGHRVRAHLRCGRMSSRCGGPLFTLAHAKRSEQSEESGRG